MMLVLTEKEIKKRKVEVQARLSNLPKIRKWALKNCEKYGWLSLLERNGHKLEGVDYV